MIGNPSDLTSALQMSKRVFLNRSKASVWRGKITLTGFLEVGSSKDYCLKKNKQRKIIKININILLLYSNSP